MAEIIPGEPPELAQFDMVRADCREREGGVRPAPGMEPTGLRTAQDLEWKLLLSARPF